MAQKNFERNVAVVGSSDFEAETLETTVTATTATAVTAPMGRIMGVGLGRLAGLPSSEGALVTLRGREWNGPIHARTLVSLDEKDIGREIALMFEGGDPERPVIIGCVEDVPTRTVEDVPTRTVEDVPTRTEKPSIVESERADFKELVSLDAETIVLTGKREVVLRCGKASITLTRAGKVLIRGAYLLSRSSGVNRIKGGSVNIN